MIFNKSIDKRDSEVFCANRKETMGVTMVEERVSIVEMFLMKKIGKKYFVPIEKRQWV